jgi:hypothetical protein
MAHTVWLLAIRTFLVGSVHLPLRILLFAGRRCDLCCTNVVSMAVLNTQLDPRMC